MNNHKLIQVFETFDKKEWREFSKFVESPYFNTDKHCIRLMEILRKEFAKKDDFQLSRTRLEKLFSKNNPANASLLNVKLSLLTRLTEQFLTHQNLESDNLLSSHLLLNNFLKRGLDRHFDRVYRKRVQVELSKGKAGSNFYIRKFMIESDFYQYLVNLDTKIILKEEHLQEFSNTLDLLYLNKKVEIWGSMNLLAKDGIRKNYDFSSFKAVDILFESSALAQYPLVQIYHAVYKLEEEYPLSTAYFELLRELLLTHAHLIDSTSLKSIYAELCNYCVTRSMHGQNEYVKILYTIYKEREATNALMLEKWVDIISIRNMLMCALSQDEFEWADYLIEKYKDKIAPTFRKCTYNYFRGLYFLYKKDFDKTIQYLSKVYKTDSEFDINIKMTLIKAYYEKDTEFSYHTEQVIRSFKSFVKQHKNISGYAEKACINFSLITNTLYRIKHQEGRETVDNAISKLENSEFILAEKWLLEKIKELQNRPVRRVQF